MPISRLIASDMACMYVYVQFLALMYIVYLFLTFNWREYETSCCLLRDQTCLKRVTLKKMLGGGGKGLNFAFKC